MPEMFSVIVYNNITIRLSDQFEGLGAVAENGTNATKVACCARREGIKCVPLRMRRQPHKL